MNSKSLVLITLLGLLHVHVAAQMLTNMKQTVNPQEDEELSRLFIEMNKFTYSFCQKEVYAESDHSGGYKKISHRYNIIGLFDSSNGTYARKIVYERILKKNKTNFSDSVFQLSVLEKESFNKDKAREFFSSLNSFGFDQLDNECLTKTRFADPDHPGRQRIEILSDTYSETIFLLAHGKIRRVDSYLPEYIFSKHPDESLCRAVYIICRNMFEDRIWK